MMPMHLENPPCSLAFVYGTLKHGFSNHWLIKASAARGTRTSSAWRRRSFPLVCGPFQTSITVKASGVVRSCRILAAIVRPNRMAYPWQSTCSLSPSQPARSSVMTSGVRVRGKSVVPWPLTWRPMFAWGPTSTTLLYDTNKLRSSSKPSSQRREVRMTEQVTVDQGPEQPYPYKRVELVEPDWTRFPGWKDVTAKDWASVQWQRAHCVKNIRQLRTLMGDLLEDRFYDDLEQDQQQRATMSMLVPPQMINTMVPHATPTTDELYIDPIRRYMLPVLSDRRTDWPSHPHAARDSLHEHDMWVVEGLTHRYPTKVLAELLKPTCPQYCGHCTRMDLVSNSTPVIDKLKFNLKPVDRIDAMLEYLRSNPSVRDVVVSGGDVANMPWAQLESFVDQVLDVDNIRDIRLATKALMGLPQHWLQDEVRTGMERLATKARKREASIAIHTHVNHANSVTPMVAKATRAMLDTGIRDVRNQGVIMGGINNDAHILLDLCFTLLDGAQIMPYYFYMCDMIPFSEHWRVSVARAQELQHGIMGYLPGFATPRIVCDVPFVGKRWVHQLESYDRVHGISYWSKNYRTSIERTDANALTRTYEYYDPIHTLPQAGQDWWREHAGNVLAAVEEAAKDAAESQKSLPLV